MRIYLAQPNKINIYRFIFTLLLPYCLAILLAKQYQFYYYKDLLIDDDIVYEKNQIEISDEFLTWNCINNNKKIQRNGQERQIECHLVFKREKSDLYYNFNNKISLNSFHQIQIQFEMFFSTLIQRQHSEINQNQNRNQLQIPFIPQITHKLPQKLNISENWILMSINDLNGQNSMENLRKLANQLLQQNKENTSFVLLKNIKLKMKICPDLCQSCESNGTDTFCNQCVENSILNQKGKCICKYLHIKGQNKCTEQCPIDFVEDTKNQLCVSKLNQNCASWVLNFCEQCIGDNYINLNGQCIEKQQLKNERISHSLNQRSSYFSIYFRNQTQDISESQYVTYMYLKNDQKTNSSNQHTNASDQKRFLNENKCNISFCVVCLDNDKCSKCQSQYYNIDGKCLKDLKLIEFDDNSNMILLIITSIVFCLAFIETIIISYLRNPNTILLNTSFAIQKISYLNLTALNLPIQTPDLLKSFNCNFLIELLFFPTKYQFCGKYYQVIIQNRFIIYIIILKTEISPFMIFKSTSWISESIQSHQKKQYVNYFFSINSVDSNIVSNSSGSLLFMIYSLIVFLIFAYSLNKRFQNAFKIYQKIICGILFQISAQSTQILIFGFVLQIIYFTSKNENITATNNINEQASNKDLNGVSFSSRFVNTGDLSDDSLLPLYITMMILNVLFVSISFFFYYKQANIAQDNVILHQINSIYKVNRKVIQNNCHNITWILRNYTLLLIIKESIVTPIIIILCKDQLYSSYIILIVIDSLHVALQLYTRPYQYFLDNIYSILCQIIWISIFIMKLIFQIQTNNLNISHEYKSLQEPILQTLKNLDIAVFAMFMIILLSYQIFPIIKFFLFSKENNESLQPLIRQVDTLQKIQLSAFGYYRENYSIFKIKEEYLNELKLKKEYQQYKQSRLSSKMYFNQSQIDTASPSTSQFTPSPQQAPIKTNELNKSNNNILQQIEYVNKDKSKKTSILIEPKFQNNENTNKNSQIKSINEIKEKSNIQALDSSKPIMNKINLIPLFNNNQTEDKNSNKKNSNDQITNQIKNTENTQKSSSFSFSLFDQSNQIESDSSF